jgi:hypothetical protein
MSSLGDNPKLQIAILRGSLAKAETEVERLACENQLLHDKVAELEGEVQRLTLVRGIPSVFVVERGSGDHYRIAGVFSNPARALAFAQRTRHRYGEWEISQWLVDIAGRAGLGEISASGRFSGGAWKIETWGWPT